MSTSLRSSREEWESESEALANLEFHVLHEIQQWYFIVVRPGAERRESGCELGTFAENNSDSDWDLTEDLYRRVEEFAIAVHEKWPGLSVRLRERMDRMRDQVDNIIFHSTDASSAKAVEAEGWIQIYLLMKRWDFDRDQFLDVPFHLQDEPF